MADWVTISSLATAGGTLVLAVATFAAVRRQPLGADRRAVALQEQRRPLLAESRLDDRPEQKIMFVDQHWVHVDGGHAVAESVDGVVYLVMSLRNVGAGIGVCQGWAVRAGLQRTAVDHFPRTSSGPRRATCTSRPATWAYGRGRSATPTIPVTARSSRAIEEPRADRASSSSTQTRSAPSARSPGSR